MTEKNEKSGNMPQEKNEANEIGSLSEDYKKEYAPEEKKIEQQVETADPDRFPGFTLDLDGKIKKPKVGEHVGPALYLTKEHSTKYNCDIHKFKSKDSNVPIVLVGSTVLDKKLKLHETGEILIVQRAANTVNQKGQIVHNWNIYKKEN